MSDPRADWLPDAAVPVFPRRFTCSTQKDHWVAVCGFARRRPPLPLNFQVSPSCVCDRPCRTMKPFSSMNWTAGIEEPGATVQTANRITGPSSPCVRRTLRKGCRCAIHSSLEKTRQLSKRVNLNAFLPPGFTSPLQELVQTQAAHISFVAPHLFSVFSNTRAPSPLRIKF